jgi:midasin (ATPase involved in ribosome maturation)
LEREILFLLSTISHNSHGTNNVICEKSKVMKDLQRYRQGSKVFAGKHGFITLRDLFKWADRRPASYEELAQEGYMLLAERLRNPEEKNIVKVRTNSLHSLSLSLSPSLSDSLSL